MMYIQANDPDILSLMKIIDEEGKVIPWEYNAFPDGQVQIKIKKEALEETAALNVKASLPNPIVLDLFNQFLHSFRPKNITINYLYGARCDKGVSGNYFVCNVAAKQALYDIGRAKYLAPHCNHLLHPDDVIFDLPSCVNLDDYDMIVFPDESALERYRNQVKGKDYVVCEKHRDQESGAIISHKIPNLPDGAKKVILLDDLVDGGKSFMNIAETLPTGMFADLFVFHGVLSNSALSKLLEKFNKVIVSNSLLAPQRQKDALSDEDKNRVVIFDVWS